MDSKAFIKALNNIVEEKNISPDIVFDAMQLALQTAYKKNFDSKNGKGTSLSAPSFSVGAEKNVIASVDTGSFTVDAERKLLLNDVPMAKVTGLSDALDGKVDKVEGYTLLSPTDKTKLDALVIGESGVEISGKVNAANVEGLGDWITTNRDTVPGLLSATEATKLAGIADGAQVNVLEAVAIDGVDLTIEGKKVNIPLATTTTAGALSATDKVIIDSIATTYATKTELSDMDTRVTALEGTCTWGEI